MSVQLPIDLGKARSPDREGLPVIGLIVSAQFSVSGFAKRWVHCNQLANYFARFASANAPDPERQSTLLSTFFNEVLEVLFRNQSGDGQIKLSFQQTSRRLTLQAEVPVHEPSRAFYKRAVGLANRSDLDVWYREWLENGPSQTQADDEGAMELAVGLLELVAVYDTTLTLEEPGEGLPLLLKFEFPYENEEVE
jgi:hypothetical protein